MLRAKDIMTRRVITFSPAMEIAQAAKVLLEEDINGVPVMEQDRIVGILCRSDLIAQQKNLPLPSVFKLLDGFIPLKSAKSIEKTVKKIAATKVSDAMTSDPVTVDPDTGVEEIAVLMLDRNFHTIPVIEKGKLVGIIGKEDMLRTLVPAAE